MNRPTLVLLLFYLFATIVSAQGTVYIVMGSDTGIWNGLDTKKYYHNYGLELYTDPAENAYTVMDPAFRAPMTDSYGTPLKMTWWMMSGNTFRHSKNTNIPYPNSVTFYLMKEYHGAAMQVIGDELSLHYHTFYWSDYDGDGVYFYNQALTFEESQDDFEYTLSQNLIDEDVFPVSFRSGWHAMDNAWQHYLEDVLPFSMHNDYPKVHNDTIEPYDNLYDWSLAPGTWEPYHPSYENYQVPGDLNGYNLRSVYMEAVNTTKLNEMFQNAAQGKDQMACFWAHLPEDDFPYNIGRVDSLLQVVSANYPEVKFKYCTGIEAMQEWLGNGDLTAPEITIDQYESGEGYIYEISTDELIFQSQPFVAVKDIYERYERLQCQRIGLTKWRTKKIVDRNIIAKLGVAVTDTSGNLQKKYINYLPDDTFYDNSTQMFSTLYGNWQTANDAAWREDAMVSPVNQGDSVAYSFHFSVEQNARYNLFLQAPAVPSPVEDIYFYLKNNENVSLLSELHHPMEGYSWIRVGTEELEAGVTYQVIVKGVNSTNEVLNLAADVFKVSALVRDKELYADQDLVNLGLVAINKEKDFEIKFGNRGYESLTITGIESIKNQTEISEEFPLVLDEYGEATISFTFYPGNLGSINDTLIIYSDDVVNPVKKIAITGGVEPPFLLVDNEDPGYSEMGNWHTSVTQAYGNSSRYGYINQSEETSASFSTIAESAGKYEAYMIIPKSTNSATNALYELYRNNQKIAQTHFNQNNSTGIWNYLFDGVFVTGDIITLKVIDDGTSSAGPVIRADAAKFSQLSGVNSVDDDLELSYNLEQNYPNPFNPVTTISYSIPESGHVSVKIFDVLGRMVSEIVNQDQSAGKYHIEFNASNISSGVYFYSIKAGKFSIVRKMMVLK